MGADNFKGLCRTGTRLSSNHAEWASLAVRDAGEEKGVLRMDGGFWDSLVLKPCDLGN